MYIDSFLVKTTTSFAKVHFKATSVDFYYSSHGRHVILFVAVFLFSFLPANVVNCLIFTCKPLNTNCHSYLSVSRYCFLYIYVNIYASFSWTLLSILSESCYSFCLFIKNTCDYRFCKLSGLSKFSFYISDDFVLTSSFWSFNYSTAF